MNWIAEAKKVFTTERPDDFTNFRHCCECAEHNETLKNHDLDSVSMQELGNPAWDPLCFCDEDGKKYFFPALVRLSLETVNDDFYFGQLLFHLEYVGEDNDFFGSCTAEQKAFVAAFVQYMIEAFPEQIDLNFCSDDALRVFEMWKS